MVSHTDSKLQYYSARRSRRGCDRSVLRLVCSGPRPIRLPVLHCSTHTRASIEKGRFDVQKQ